MLKITAYLSKAAAFSRKLNFSRGFWDHLSQQQIGHFEVFEIWAVLWPAALTGINNFRQEIAYN